jgi:ferric enterobactin receptor
VPYICRANERPAFAVKALAASFALIGLAATPVLAQQAQETRLSEVHVLGTAEEELKQAPGVSTITAEDIEKRPPANDLSEIIRTMPGVNLSGNSSTGMYGNNRQIDLRGMGPENTLILIDGKPVMSRQTAYMGRQGERNTRGDSNWVPAEAVERIEVLRGPAAARYGSGASGGVVNIITRRPSSQLAGSLSLYALQPEDRDESDTRRASFHLSGPLGEKFSFRVYGNANKTNADSPRTNAEAAGTTGTALPPAGREGVRNRDLSALLRWDLAPGHVLEFEGGFSRQGSIYGGEREGGANAATIALATGNKETNTLYRRSGSMTYRGNHGEGRASKVLLSYEGTTNRRMAESPSQGIVSQVAPFLTTKMDNYLVSGEYDTPLVLGGVSQMLTVGAEYTKHELDVPSAQLASKTGNNWFNTPGRSINETRLAAVFVEDNIEIARDFILTPGLRLDHHNRFGHHLSPSLNASYSLTPAWTLKGGIARAFKAPNLYQLNPEWVYAMAGGGTNGCTVGGIQYPAGATCRIRGNEDLEPEISVNKEIGIAYAQAGWASGLTYFANDYKNKIVADMGDDIPPANSVLPIEYTFQWFNSGKAIVRGVEGYLNIPILGREGRTLKLSNNFTWMGKNENRSTNQPLSVLPKYTVNSTLDWQASDKLSLQLFATFYGRQKPRTRNVSTANNTPITGAGLEERKPYALWGLSGGYVFSKNLRLRAGVNNLFDKRLYREGANSTSAGAATYNEAGRSFYVNLTTSF